MRRPLPSPSFGSTGRLLDNAMPAYIITAKATNLWGRSRGRNRGSVVGEGQMRDLPDKIVKQANALWANLPADQVPNADDVVDISLSEDGDLEAIIGKNARMLYVWVDGETVCLKYLAMGIVELTTRCKGRMTRMGTLRRNNYAPGTDLMTLWAEWLDGTAQDLWEVTDDITRWL